MFPIDVYSLVDSPSAHAALQRWQQAGHIVKHYLHSTTDLPEIPNSAHANVLVLCPKFDSSALSLLNDVLEHFPDPITRPYIVLLTQRFRLSHRVDALALGADWTIELDGSDALIDSRFEAMLRRRRGFSKNPALTFPPYTLHPKKSAVEYMGKSITLSARDYCLAELFFTYRGKTLSRKTLLRIIWNIRELKSHRRVDAKVSLLRRQLELDSSYQWELRAARTGGGYVLIPNIESKQALR